MLRRAPLLFVVALALLPSCGGRLPRPPIGPSPAEDIIEVPYPPPAARVEFVPERPRADAVWVDGQWGWEGNRWRWQLGGWVVVPPLAYYAPWRTFRRPDGTLAFARAAWLTKNHELLPWPTVLAPAMSRPNAEELEK